MKRFRLVLMILLAASVLSCKGPGKPKREKITDPEQREAMRTRKEDVPIDSLFSSGALKEVLSPFEKISIGQYLSDFKSGYRESAEPAARKKYADRLRKKEKMKEEEALEAAAKADSTALASVRVNAIDRMNVTRQNLPAENYNPSLTLYFLVVLVLFAVIFTIRVILAFFVSPRKD